MPDLVAVVRSVSFTHYAGIWLPFLKNPERDRFEGSVRTWVDSLMHYPAWNAQGFTRTDGESER